LGVDEWGLPSASRDNFISAKKTGKNQTIESDKGGKCGPLIS